MARIEIQISVQIAFIGKLFIWILFASLLRRAARQHMTVARRQVTRSGTYQAGEFPLVPIQWLR